MKKYVLNVFQNILKDAVKNPKEATFIVKFGMGVNRTKRRRKYYKEKGESIPKVLVGSLNSNCNFFCRGCYKRNNKKIIVEKENVLSSLEWKKILERAKDLGVFSFIFAGGEPLKRKDVLKEAAKIKSIVFPTFVSIDSVGESDVKMFNENRNIIPVLKLEGKGKNESNTFVSLVKSFKRFGIYYGVALRVNKENRNECVSDNFVNTICNYGCKALLLTEDDNGKIIDDSDREFLKLSEKRLRKKYEDVLFFYINEKDKENNKCLGFDEEILQISSKGSINKCIYIK